MDKHCRICHNTSCSNHGKNISFLGDGWKCNYIPVPTNADRIRAMSDEELVEFLYNYKFTDMCEEGCDLCHYHGDCENRLADWLKQPAEEDDHA